MRQTRLFSVAGTNAIVEVSPVGDHSWRLRLNGDCGRLRISEVAGAIQQLDLTLLDGRPHRYRRCKGHQIIVRRQDTSEGHRVKLVDRWFDRRGQYLFPRRVPRANILCDRSGFMVRDVRGSLVALVELMETSGLFDRAERVVLVEYSVN